jgi:hypothetical protein
LRVRLPPLPLCLWCKGSIPACEAVGAGSIPVRHISEAEHGKANHDRGVLLGEQRASKTRAQGSNPCAPAVGVKPLECDGRHTVLRKPQTRFDSWRGYSGFFSSSECEGRTRPCEGRGPGSTPGGDIFINDAGARRPGDRLQTGLKWVRLPPASLAAKPTAGASHDFSSKRLVSSVGPWRRLASECNLIEPDPAGSRQNGAGRERGRSSRRTFA